MLKIATKCDQVLNFMICNSGINQFERIASERKFPIGQKASLVKFKISAKLYGRGRNELARMQRRHFLSSKTGVPELLPRHWLFGVASQV